MGIVEIIVIGTGIAAGVAVLAGLIGVAGYFFATSGARPDSDGSTPDNEAQPPK